MSGVNPVAVAFTVVVHNCSVIGTPNAVGNWRFSSLWEHSISFKSSGSTTVGLSILSTHALNMLRESSLELNCHITTTGTSFGRNLGKVDVQFRQLFEQVRAIAQFDWRFIILRPYLFVSSFIGGWVESLDHVSKGFHMCRALVGVVFGELSKYIPTTSLHFVIGFIYGCESWQKQHDFIGLGVFSELLLFSTEPILRGQVMFLTGATVMHQNMECTLFALARLRNIQETFFCPLRICGKFRLIESSHILLRICRCL